MTRVLLCLAAVASLVVCLTAQKSGTYPLALSLDAHVTTPTTSIVSKVAVRVDRLMEENRRVRVADALKHGGYPNFLPALRAHPRVGTIAVGARPVDVKSAREQPDGDGRRLVLVADRPLFFLGGAESKKREGYELTIVDLRFDAKGDVTGMMTGAARVKPSPESEVVVDDFAEAPVQLTGSASRP